MTKKRERERARVFAVIRKSKDRGEKGVLKKDCELV